jgi:LuxR family quorum sensing-dependent transcriptional regulator
MSTPDAERVFDFIDGVHGIQTMSELNQNFRKIIERWGFDGWGCIQVSDSPAEIKAPLMRIFGELNQDWVARYMEANHIDFDTAAHEVMKRTRPFWWSEITHPRLVTKRQSRVYDEAGDFGLNKGLAIPVRFPDGSVWSVMLYGRKVEDEAPRIKELLFLAAQYYAGHGMHLGDKARSPVKLASHLTERQRQVTQMLRFGSTQLQIARVLGLSESTINNLVNEAKDRLSAHTTAELVAEALLRGEIPGNAQHFDAFAK